MWASGSHSVRIWESTKQVGSPGPLYFEPRTRRQNRSGSGSNDLLYSENGLSFLGLPVGSSVCPELRLINERRPTNLTTCVGREGSPAFRVVVRL